MLYIVFLAIFLAFVIFVTVNGFLDNKKPKDAIVTEKMKCKDYILSIAVLWGTTLAVFIMSVIGNISPADLGFRPISFNCNIWFTAVILILSGLAFAYLIYQTISLLTRPKWREKQALTGTQGALAILPRTKKEKWFYTLLSFSAGVCEEIFYRGFLVFLLYAIFPDMPIYLIVLITAVMFGVSHFYQGVNGIISTGLVGAALMCLFLVTNSLILPILLHFFMDVSSAFVLTEEQANE